MARTKDTRAKVPKAAGATAPTKARRAATAGAKTAKPRAAAKTSPPRASKSRKASLEAVRTPLAEVTETTKKKAKKAKKALKAAKAQALKLVPKVHASAMPAQVGDSFKAIGKQIAGALNTDIGRVMVAGMLISVAKSLTKAAAGTEAAGGAKSTLLNAGAKVGAAAADAGSTAVGRGKKVVDAGVKAAGKTGESAKGVLLEVASAAVGALGSVVADVAEKAIGRRRGRPPSAKTVASKAAASGPAAAEAAGPKTASPKAASAKAASPKAASPKTASPKAASPKAASPTTATSKAETSKPDSASEVPKTGSASAPPIAADAGHQPPAV